MNLKPPISYYFGIYTTWYLKILTITYAPDSVILLSQYFHILVLLDWTAFTYLMLWNQQEIKLHIYNFIRFLERLRESTEYCCVCFRFKTKFSRCRRKLVKSSRVWRKIQKNVKSWQYDASTRSFDQDFQLFRLQDNSKDMYISFHQVSLFETE